MRDAAAAAGIGASWHGAVGGYYGGPAAWNVWKPGDWKRFAGRRKLPIWAAGLNGADEAATAARALYDLGVPSGAYTAVAMENRVDRTYLGHFGAILATAGYKVWVYGSASTVFGNPALDGYWVGDWAGIGPFMYHRAGAEVRATQYALGVGYDRSEVKDWTYYFGRWWR
jgi:hypothetical protein